jgi:hypothetical protein
MRKAPVSSAPASSSSNGASTELMSSISAFTSSLVEEIHRTRPSTEVNDMHRPRALPESAGVFEPLSPISEPQNANVICSDCVSFMVRLTI